MIYVSVKYSLSGTAFDAKGRIARRAENELTYDVVAVRTPSSASL
jgi:hypothetical protein